MPLAAPKAPRHSGGTETHWKTIMAHAEFLQLGECLLRALVVDALDAAAAIAGDDAEFVFVRLEQLGDKLAAARLEISQHAHLVVKTFARVWPVIHLDHPPVPGDVHGSAQRVFDFMHETNSGRASCASAVRV